MRLGKGFGHGLSFNGRPVTYSEAAFDPNRLDYNPALDLTWERVTAGGRYPLELVLIDPVGNRHTVDSATVVVATVPLWVTLRRDKYDTDVDTHVYASLGRHSRYANLCGIRNGCLDRDDVDGFGPEVFALAAAPSGVSYSVKLHYYSDHGNGATTATVVVEVNGRVVTTRTVSLVAYQWVDIGTYTPQP